MSNMDDFNEAVAVILAKLYETFPRGTLLVVRDLAKDASDDRLGNFGGTISFLQKEGFISYESRLRDEQFNGVVLTSKGLAILNSTPESLKESKSLGSKLVAVLKEGSKEAIKALVQQVIRGALPGSH